MGGLAQIRARLLHETTERESREAQAFGVELENGLTKPFALMQRLSHNWRRGFGFQSGAQVVQKRDQSRFVCLRHRQGGGILAWFNSVQYLNGV